MPLYEYECESCGIHFERKERITAEPLKTCPECSGAVHRLIHPVGIIFKGSGFYCTDNRSSSTLGTPKSESKSNEPSSAAASETKSAPAKAD
ncbi:MAG: zinc ribbon domain-containing protein [Chloroflexi bacterium]|nr:zinc ribbon domain-containing protein [Chloroflexota bacterium]